MKNFTVTMIMSVLIYASSISTNPVILTSSLISLIDGKLITADSIELMQLFAKKIRTLIAKHNIRNRAQEETSVTLLPDARAQLEVAKKDFLTISHQFMAHARGAKSILNSLMEQDCERRQRLDSHLLTWSKTQDDRETESFNTAIRSFSSLYTFCVDLLHFLNDMMHSCPKALAQFELRLRKWNTIRDIVESGHYEAPADLLKYIKQHHLDKLALHEITPSKIAELITHISPSSKIR